MTGPIPERYRRWLEMAFTIAALAGVIAVDRDQLIEQDPGPRGSPHVPHAPTAGIADADDPPLVCAANTDRRR